MSDEPGTEVEDLEGFKDLIRRAKAGDTSVLPEMSRHLNERPGVWRVIGDLRTQAEQLWTELIAGSNLVRSESIANVVGTLKQSVMGPNPTPMIRLLADRVVLSWLQLHHADLDLACHLKNPEVAPRRVESVSRRQQQLMKGYLKSLAMLETVQRLVPVTHIPDGGGSPRAADPPTSETPEEGADVLPMPSDQSDQDDPARRIAAQIRSENQSEPMRRAQ